MSKHDYVTWKILEYNTEILFVLVNTYSVDYKKYVKKKYWTGGFDMIHLLLNQLGLPEVENWKEVAKLANIAIIHSLSNIVCSIIGTKCQKFTLLDVCSEQDHLLIFV